MFAPRDAGAVAANRRGGVTGAGSLLSWLRPSERRRRRTLAAFQQEVRAACTAGEAAAVDRLASRLLELGLTEEDAAIELEMIEGLRELGELTARVATDGLPVLETSHRAVAGETCYLVLPMSLPDSATQASGKLFLTERRLVWFAEGTRSTLSWGGAGVVRREARDLLVVSADRQRAYRFRCNSYGEALRAAFIAEWHLERRRRGSAQPL
jgi:hypothetical protein